MNFETYQQKAAEFAVYPKDREREYLSLGLISEVGELAGKLKKEIRDGVDLTEAILDECGDIMWYVAMNCNAHGRSLDGLCSIWREEQWSTQFVPNHKSVLRMVEHTDDMFRDGGLDSYGVMDFTWELKLFLMTKNTHIEAVCEANIAKLTDRKNRGKLQGSGDTR